MDGAAEDEVRAPVGLELGVVRLFFLASSLGRARAQKQIVWTCGLVDPWSGLTQTINSGQKKAP